MTTSMTARRAFLALKRPRHVSPANFLSCDIASSLKLPSERSLGPWSYFGRCAASLDSVSVDAHGPDYGATTVAHPCAKRHFRYSISRPCASFGQNTRRIGLQYEDVLASQPLYSRCRARQRSPTWSVCATRSFVDTILPPSHGHTVRTLTCDALQLMSYVPRARRCLQHSDAAAFGERRSYPFSAIHKRSVSAREGTRPMSVVRSRIGEYAYVCGVVA
ncbi:hypothetical protein FKP32DRAFT_239537 [Trametes sanguinea]|nr:hypothetical protein FKP32DRAFT_239537 [Trametes sanguinea]